MSEKLTKLLFVEDDESIAQIVMMTLQDLGGLTVKHCNSGQMALETVSDYAPQLVLLDVMMPGMSGPETFEKLKEIPNAKHVSVIFMTAKAQTHEQEKYLETGAIGVIVKPFDPMTLTDQITQMWTAAKEKN